MRAPTPHTIHGRRFEIAPMGAFRGLRVMERLAKVLGPALGQVAASGKDVLGKGAGVTMEGALNAAASGFGSLAERLDGATLEWLARELAADTAAETEQGGMVPLLDNFDLYFAGRYPMLFEWAKAAFEVNFGPLGAALKGLGVSPGASVATPK